MMRTRFSFRFTVPWALLTLVVLFTSVGAFGQVDYSTATLQGTVLDAQGRAVPAATITITNPDTGLTKSQQSGADGTYTFPLLPVGAYQITVTATGFDKSVTNGINLAVGQAVVQDIHLQVGETSTVVEVTTSAPLISVEQTQQSNEINQNQIQELPNINHSFDTYVLTLPGVSNIGQIENAGSQRAVGGTFNTFVTGGGSARGGLVYIDGGENDSGEGVSRTYHLPVDAIADFTVNRNGSTAEYGFTYAEAVTIATKGGTNTLHGNAFGLFRDQHTDAIQYFQQTSASGHALFDQDFHAGASLGGPIIKNKLFFFMAYEGYQNAFQTSLNFINAQYNPGITTSGIAVNPVTNAVVATGGQVAYIADIAAGGAGACGALTCTQLATDLTFGLNPSHSKAVQGLIGAPGNIYGIPSQSGTFTNKDTWQDGIVRVDYNLDANNTFMLRGLLEKQNQNAAYGGSEYAQIAGTPPDAAGANFNKDYEMVATWNHIFSPTLFNALRFQMVPEFIFSNPTIASQQEATQPFNIVAPLAFGPVLGPQIGYLSNEKRYQFEDSVSWTRGSHSFKFGLSYRPAKYIINNPLYHTSQIVYIPGLSLTFAGGPSAFGPSAIAGQAVGSYTPPLSTADLSAINSYNAGFAPTSQQALDFQGAALSNFQAFASVIPIQFRTSFGSGKFVGWGHYGGIYAQDTWKVNSRFTITPGLRFDVNAEPFPSAGVDNGVCEIGTNQTEAQVAAVQGAMIQDESSGTSPIAACHNAATSTGVATTVMSFPFNQNASHTEYVSPRLGLSYDLTGDAKTVLRASGGVYVGASERPAVFYSNIYNPNGGHLIQEEATFGVDPSFGNLLYDSVKNGNLPVRPPTEADFSLAGIPPVVDGPHAVYITAGDSLHCAAGDPFGCKSYRSTSSTQAALSIQRQLSTNMSLEMGYNFQRTFHLQDPEETDFQQALSAPGDPGGSGKPLIDGIQGPQLLPKNVNVETGTCYCSTGNAIYHALTTSFKRQFANNFQFQVNWTYSRAIDDVLDFSSFNSSYYPTIYPYGSSGKGRDWGLSAFNTTHNIVANAVYTTPFKGGSGSSWTDKLLANWTVAPIVTMHSGIPFEVLINPNQGIGSECTTVAECLAGNVATGNGLAQEAQNQARPYAAGRDSGYSPWLYQWDMSLKRGLTLTERFRMEFSVNFSNILNHVNFTGVDGIMSQNTFTAQTATAAPLLNGKTVNLLTGPYNFHGFKSFDQAEKTGTLLSPGLTPSALGQDPLAFVSAAVPRQIQFGLRLSF
jgi:hypothetical protein